ncbi:MULTISPECIES: DUF3319 domain-containing protein [Vibrio]|jgi:hypothetical protein|uniref:DUF3319 domain-containing protein n=1 Tax=Vibrio diazotrophicus TaxID=685 RepID=A0A2J8HN60_VIBDI|nr:MULTISPECIES: DUF3319 domain-containing protein [Vibrio]MCF7361402.1 DUF3319 domain-containing protein [Vibrio sp. A1-b2]MCZ4373192.1 DUF3319 domain-containing protein [Vibrio diazotrophicus]PNH81977.1 DUF3319 domain-containing protein [Vibrio diazotrophicus]PNH89392.1 DUF3319 domain-containing protein [Vibrio diazotrophicus]PNH92285.1 DUF3319 domain-containing protein [Vibrio diazotrophicus]
MANASYRGFTLQTAKQSADIWQVRIKNHVLSGNLAAVKKSIDWWCDTASLIDPSEFESVGKAREVQGSKEENFNGFTLKNDTGQANGWYCFFNGRLIKGSKLALQKHIEAHLLAKQRAAAQQRK